ncbi:bromodomain-containing protein [Iningainema tapete]|uniref:Bromodomain-containing protein n=1 Tax=Iningainema tapete BLCC-T55 TaxID=2748662 RepID=A0A8J7CA40_9CYAN|nr:bromodomain-containing protein [Iningainema tapete]MBD2776716.1 bromodomain-containing protein [Iningainema tapete BLCC-T55]
MDFKYKWKNGAPPTRDQAAQSQHLLDESQFNSKEDHLMAEQDARKHLGVPTRIPDDDRSVLPKAAPNDLEPSQM